MMRQYELVERVKRYNPATNEALLNRAYVYAMRAHGTQKRASGDPFFAHPLEVAALLTDLHLDDATIVAAVLHDTVEDTAATLDEIRDIFGDEIRALVDGLTKLKRLDLVSKRAVQGENFRKLLLAVAEDVRVLLVKLADRTHNMRTLHFMPPEKRTRIAEETLDIYAPLAGRMGIQEMRDELEDLSFRVLKPEVYATITKRLEDLSAKSSNVIESIEHDLTARLAAQGIAAQVKGRLKRPYSIWSKMERKSVAFEQLSDIVGFRVIVGTLAECYAALGVVHTSWPMVPGRYKDYISTPKQNDYRSIHTTVIGPKQRRVELQIRTAAMDEIAEYGIAAHALYKDGAKAGEGEVHPRLATESGAYQWLRRTIELLAEGDSPEEFLEHTKLELFQDQVFCFTPKGRLIALPRGRRRSTSPTRSIPTSATRRSAPRSTAGSRRCCTNSPTATRSRSPARTAPRRPRPGSPSSSPARRGRRSGARRGPPCAANMPASAVRFSTVPSSGRARAFRKTSCAALSPGWRVPPPTTCSPPSGGARCSPATWSRRSIPTSRTSAAPAGPRPTARPGA